MRADPALVSVGSVLADLDLVVEQFPQHGLGLGVMHRQLHPPRLEQRRQVANHDAPQRSRDEVLDALEQLGGLEAWGVGKPFDDDALYIHPGTFVEQLLPRTLEVFRDLMSTTPVEKLLNDNAEQDRLADTRPLSPQDTRTLLQLGLSLP